MLTKLLRRQPATPPAPRRLGPDLYVGDWTALPYFTPTTPPPTDPWVGPNTNPNRIP